MNISLTPSLEQFVRAKVDEGRYESASEVVRDSLRAMQSREQQQQSGWGDLNALVAEARADAAAGHVHDGETMMAELLLELHEESSSKTVGTTSIKSGRKVVARRARK